MATSNGIMMGPGFFMFFQGLEEVVEVPESEGGGSGDLGTIRKRVNKDDQDILDIMASITLMRFFE